MATKKYGRKHGKKTRKNKRGGTSQKRNTMSMKNIKKTMSDIFGEQMKATPSRSQPSRTVKAKTLEIIKAAEVELKRKQATAASKKEKKEIFKSEMDVLANKLKGVLL